jgi:hypothetical protein
LRAVGRWVLPAPKQFKDDSHVKDLVINFLITNKILRNYRNSQEFDYPSFIRSRNVTMEEMESYVHSLDSTKDHELRYSLQHWYPRIWDEWARDKDASYPQDIFGEEKKIDLNDVKRSVRFDPILPEFAFEHV